MADQDQIVVTGAGVVSTLGTTLDAFWGALQEGRRPEGLRFADPWMEISDWDAEPLLGRRGLQYLRPSARYLAGASLMALEHAHLERIAADSHARGVVVATNLSGLNSITQYDYTAISEGPRYVSPMEAPNTLANAAASHLGTRIKGQALNTTISTGQCAGLDAIGYAARMLTVSRAKHLVVGGVEELNPAVLNCYRQMGVLTDGPVERAGLPFHAESSGWVPAEGAGAVILERAATARDRGAKPLASVLAWASASPRRELEWKSGDTLKRAVKQAIAKAGVNPEAIELVISGASGARDQDFAEWTSLHSVLPASDNVAICAIKGASGETYGAGGIFQLLAAFGAIQTGHIPATAGYQADRSVGTGLSVSSRSVAWQPDSGVILLVAQDYHGNASAVVMETYKGWHG